MSKRYTASKFLLIKHNYFSMYIHYFSEEKSSRMCLRTMKYFMGIAHHCWVLGYKYIEESLKAGYYLPEVIYSKYTIHLWILMPGLNTCTAILNF